MIQILQKLKVFNDLGLEELNAIKNITIKKEVKKNQTIFKENDNGSELYVIISGKVEISKNLIGNRKKILTILEKDNFFGEISIFDNKKRSANALAIEDTELMIIQKNDFIKLLDKNDKIAHHCYKNIFLELCRRIREVNKSVQDRILWGFNFD
jgi:CRP/FNR family transcriptional regulator, cyclic AMP receptor protein